MRTDEKQNPGRIFVLRKPQSQRRSDLNTDIDDDDDNTDADDDGLINLMMKMRMEDVGIECQGWIQR